MQDNAGKIQQAGLGLAAISYDTPATLKEFAARRHITFPLISDHDSKIIRSFGILNTKVEKKKPQFGIPNPGIYVLSASGTVTAKYFEDDIHERDTAAVILMKQFGLRPDTAATSIEAKHATIRTSLSDRTARMGQHLSLLTEVELPDRVHVYAPGVKGYIPIDWIQADSGAVKTGPVKYPASKMMTLEAIHETVPVYTGRIQLTRDIVIGSDENVTPLLDTHGNLALHGSFRYQACDDRKCYLPETVPLKWTIPFQHRDRVRTAAH